MVLVSVLEQPVRYAHGLAVDPFAMVVAGTVQVAGPGRILVHGGNSDGPDAFRRLTLPSGHALGNTGQIC